MSTEGRLTVSKRERSMLLVALDNLIVDYRKAGKRHARRGLVASAAACAEAVARYTKLANRVFGVVPTPRPQRRAP